MDRLRVFGQQRDRGLFASFDGAELIERRPGMVKIAAQAAFHTRRLTDRLDAVNAVCADFFGEPTRVEITTRAEPVADSSGRTSGTPSREVERRRRQEALNHPSVNSALEILGGEIVEIRPLGHD